jgi:hypothetical protein
MANVATITDNILGDSAKDESLIGTTANSITFSNSGSGDAAGTTFNGVAVKTISYNTIGANKVITSGTAAPTGGVDGDIYFQYV